MTATKTVSVCLARRHDPDQRIRCVTCGAPDSQAWQQFRSIRLGGPFLSWRGNPDFALPCSAKSRSKYASPQRRSADDHIYRFATRGQLDSPAEWKSKRRETTFEVGYITSFGPLPSLAMQSQIDDVRRRIEVLRGSRYYQLIKMRQSWPVWKDLATVHLLQFRGMILFADLQREIPVQRFIPDATRLRYESALTNPNDIARMFLYREFARRPRSGNSTETLGMAAIYFPDIGAVNAPTSVA